MKVKKGFSEQAYELATAQHKLELLQAQVTNTAVRKRKAVQINPNTKFANIKDIQKAQVEAGDKEDITDESSEADLPRVVTIGQGFVKTFDQIMVTRFLVGVFDAGLIPGCVFLCSLYYPPTHLQWRLGLITVANICSNIAGNFMAYAIANIKTTNAFSGWRWIFIIEGIFTVVAALLCSVANVGPPEKAKFLTEEEKRVIKNSVETQTTNIGMLAEWRLFFMNPLNYCWGIIYCFTTTTAYSVSIFSPSFVKSFRPGLDATEVQAQIVPIFVVAAVACLTTAYAADRLNHRSAFGLVGFVFTIIGYAILRRDEHENSNVTMMALYFIAFGTYITLPMIWILTMQNLQTPFQRAIGSGQA
ncbi:putative transporter [Colletotrichum higginsianum]|uniref:Putative transporter n=1 Tax=Colletotrichum higginsianum TaxID=80884 RepID=A0A4T0WF45_9PEZI|nr:putative transporter [Colletotrichum higginsianum]